MDKFLHNWWGVIPSLQISRIRRFVFLSLLTLSVTGVQAQTAVEFNDGVRYSQWVIESRLGDFYGNTNDFGFTTYNRNLSVKKEVTKWKNGSAKPDIDYVAGLVAKATIEAADYYKAFNWAKPWFKSVEWYGNECTVPTKPDNLDAINASKMYFGIYALANGSFSSNAESTTASKATTQLGNALTALGNYSKEYKSDGTGGYAFPANTTVTRDSKSVSLDGGWFHKKDYLKEMWLDGQYMGPATLAQLKGEYSSYKDITTDDWALITNQFSIVWDMCWDEKEQLLYHAFCSEARSNTWAGSAEIWTTAQTTTSSWQGMTAAGHSAAFWGRAEGWYFLALVDVLEQMKNAGLDKESASNHSCYTTLKGYLDKLALGIAKRQDATSGCWYQLIGKDGNYTASYYGGRSYTETSNYLESSCTAIFAAAYLKAIRLGLLEKSTYEETAIKAYKGAVNQFMKQRTDGTVDLLSCCKSAGLGTSSTFSNDKFRDGSNAYYLLGKDVTPTSTNSADYYTEGKVMGAFIMAATEYEMANKKDIRFSYDLAPEYTLTNGQSLKVEALGSGAGTASYQWYNASDGSKVSDATSSTFAPTESGSYYCEATSGTTTIKTSTANVTLKEAVVSSDIFSLTITYNNTYSLASGQDLNLTSDYASVTGGTALVHNGHDSKAADIIYLKNNSGNISLTGSGGTYAKLTLNTTLQVGDVITFTSDENSIGSFYLTSSATKNTNCPVTSGTYTITETDGLAGANAKDIYVWNNSSGKFKSITISRKVSITNQPTVATYDVNAATVNELKFEVSATGVKEFSYQWYSNTTNSTVGGREITTNGTSNTYTPVVTTAGTTYYYCIASAGVLSVTSDVVAVAVLNPSDLKTKYNAAWTPIANGTIEVGNLVTSSSKGAYSITAGDDVAEISGKTITALKAGTFTLSQEADDTYKAGSIVITVRIGTNVTSDETNSYSFTAQTAVSDGMTITRKNITMTFGNDGFWSLPSADSYTGGQVNPTVPANNIPTAGTFYKFTPTTTGKLAVKVKLGFLEEEGKLRPLYVSESGTLITAKLEDGTQVGKGEKPDATEAYNNKSITFPVKANTDYYVYVNSSKLGFYGFEFTPVTLYTVTFNAGSNGTCDTKSIIQESQGASITLPDVTPAEGYTFDGWYTAETGGTKEESSYTPTENVTLYAHYTSTGGEETGAEEPVTIDGDNETSDVVSLTGGSWSGSGASAYYGLGSAGSFTIASNNSNASISKIVLTYTENKSDRYGGTVTVTPGTYSYSSSAIQGTWTGSANSVTFTTSDKCRIKSIVVYYTTGPSLSFTTQPSNKDYAQGVSVNLTVAAAVSNDTNKEYGDVTYKWYSNTTESNQNGTPLDGEDEATLTPSTAELGTTYYYCVATAAKTSDASQELTATSNVVAVTVSAPSIEFTTQPQGAVYTKSETENAAALTVAATTNFKGTVTYQWYSNTTGKIPTTAEGLAAEIMSGAATSSHKPSITTTGKTYYYCIATSEYNSNSYTAASDIVCIEVVTALYSYNVQGKDQPKCNESRWIEDGNSNKLVKFTFGGWKYNNNKYLKPNADDIEANYITDEWSEPKQQDKVNALDGYEYAISGKYDAVQENKAEKTIMYKKDRYGWFRSPERTEVGITKESYPFTLPVRGAYMTFEPTKNGILTIYLLQNGAWNTDGNNDIIAGQFRMHAFQITNQRGLVLEEFAPKYSVTCNQKVLGGYSCTEYETDPNSYDDSSKDISNWKEFWDLSLKERKAVHDNWNNGTNGSQTIIKLDNGSFLAIQKAIVKYEFHVTGNETYYVFSNFSKLGFAGAAFQPDEKQPTDVTTFSGAANSLDETKKYTKITAEKQSTFIDEAKKMYEYKYTIGGNEVGKVSGVFIPQFKDITLNRTFKANQWTTLTLPFNLTQSEVEEIFGVGTRLIVLDKGTNNSGAVRLKFVYHEIQNVLPGYPYLIKPTKEVTTSFTVHNKCINPHISQLEIDCEDYIFKGVTDYCTPDADGYSVPFDEGDIFVSNGDGKLYISGGNSYSKGYRAYIKKPGTQSAKSISIVMNSFSDDDDTTTSIDVAEFDPTLLESLGLPVGVYNLNGQRVGNDTRNLRPGIYIVNGKKTVVK